MKRRTPLWFLIITAVVFIGVAGLLPRSSREALGQNAHIFGGYITSSIPCTCNGFFLLTLTPPVGGQYLYRIGARQYENYRLPSAGVWTLGLYTPGGVCLVYAGKTCVSIGNPKGIITPTVGTSL